MRWDRKRILAAAGVVLAVIAVASVMIIRLSYVTVVPDQLGGSTVTTYYPWGPPAGATVTHTAPAVQVTVTVTPVP